MFKKIIIGIIIYITVTGIFSGCVSNRRDSSDLLEYQREVARLEAELRSINKSIEVSNSRLDEDIGRLKELSERSSEIGNSIDGIIDLFDRYQSAVERLIRDYYSSRRTDKVKE